MKTMVFTGVEGSNPLGFLAALGAARLAEAIWPGVRLEWFQNGGWKARATDVPVQDPQEFCRLLNERGAWAPLEAFRSLGENLTVSTKKFAPVVKDAMKKSSAKDRRAADFAAAFGCEVLSDERRDRMQYTDLCFITGSGHQDFLGTARGLEASCGPEQIEEALFGPWRYGDKGLSMRWDPDDAKEYALRWRDPSVGGVSSVWGANRLAFEALPLFPAVPTHRGLRTTGFETRARAHELTWPIWAQPAGVDTIRSLLALPELQAAVPNRKELHAMGVEEVFRVQRVRIGQGANFKVSFRSARAV
jgi:hypothetical protein